MKRFILVLLGATLLQLQIVAQSNIVTFHFEEAPTKGVQNVAAMEVSISKLLSAINVACIDGKSLTFSGFRIDATAKKDLESLWENMHFYCEEELIAGRCLQNFQGIQVRDIPITLKPLAKHEGNLEKELTISLSKTGVITGVHIAFDDDQIRQVLNAGHTMNDQRMRMAILQFLEGMREYYLSKNLDALVKLYSDDALIFSEGKLLAKRTDAEMPISSKYRVETKVELLARVSELLKKNKSIDVAFDRISIVQHSTKQQFYGVTLHQSFKDNPQCDAWLFMLWEFIEQDVPIIHIRSWQMEEDVEKNEVFELNDFDL